MILKIPLNDITLSHTFIQKYQNYSMYVTGTCFEQEMLALTLYAAVRPVLPLPRVSGAESKVGLTMA